MNPQVKQLMRRLVPPEFPCGENQGTTCGCDPCEQKIKTCCYFCQRRGLCYKLDAICSDAAEFLYIEWNERGTKYGQITKQKKAGN